MRSGIRYSSFALVSVLLLALSASSSAQQVRFEDFSNTAYATQYLCQNYQPNQENCQSPHLATYQGNSVLRLTDGGSNNPEASTVYFNINQNLTKGFTTWFEFQTHNPTSGTNQGDGVAFIIQNSNATDGTQGASGAGLTALGAGSAQNQAGGMGYSGINNSLVVEFDINQNAWDPNSNHIAVQSCGTNYNSPVHLPGDYTIGSNNMVESCLYMNGINDSNQIPMIAGACSGSQVCSDGIVHQVVIEYTPPGNSGSGVLQVWLDTVDPATHNPIGAPAVSVPLTIEDLLGLSSTNCPPDTNCSALIGFTASQPDAGTAQDILAWEFTPHTVLSIQQLIPPGGIQATYPFGSHQAGVTYPMGFQNINNILMTVTATPTDRNTFYQTRLLGTQFANEQCIVYLGTGGVLNQPLATGSCLVYTVTCQDQMGNQVTCPMEPQCASDPNQCIDSNTTFYTSDQVSPTNADYLENDAIGSNNWMSIFTSYMNEPEDGTTSGKGGGFGGGGDLMNLFKRYRSYPVPRTIKLAPQGSGADLVATFRPGQP